MIQWWYSFKHIYFPKLIAVIAKKIIFLLLKTCRVKVIGLEKLQIVNHQKTILIFWHNRLVLAPALLYKFCRNFRFGVLVSQSRDGEIISSIVNSYKIAQSIRVKHDSKIEALNRSIEFLNDKKGILVVTPDGPRGPRYKTKKGIAFIAKNSNANLIPMSWSANKFWKLKSWDQLIIPKPFSKIVLTFGDPFSIKPDSEIPTKLEIDEIESQINQIKKINLSELESFNQKV